LNEEVIKYFAPFAFVVELTVHAISTGIHFGDFLGEEPNQFDGARPVRYATNKNSVGWDSDFHLKFFK
jgi:hypothetical protein